MRVPLHVGGVPVFAPQVDLALRVELVDELAGARRRIMRADVLIDQVVYRLCGLSKEEIAIMEARCVVPAEVRRTYFSASRSASAVWRSATLSLRTAMPTARFVPTSTTSSLARVTPV